VVDKRSQGGSWPPAGVWLPAAFFVAAGVLDFVLSVFAAGHPASFDDAWTAAGRTMMNVVLAFGLWNRVWLSRTVAIVYCLGAISVYTLAILLAVTHQPLSYPPSIVIGSAFEVPLCVVVYRHLRTRHAAELFSQDLF
jgi:hypothetical protein